MADETMLNRWKAHYQLALIKIEKQDYVGARSELDFIPIKKVNIIFKSDILSTYEKIDNSLLK